MLKSIQLKDFKSFAGDARPIPLAPVTLLVGANASGKSNMLDALRFLQGIGLRRFSVEESIRESRSADSREYPGVRGGTAEVCWRGKSVFTIETTWREASAGRSGEDRLSHRMTVDVNANPAVQVGLQSERLFDEHGTLCEAQVDLIPGTRKPGISATATFRKIDAEDAKEAVASYPVNTTFCWRLDSPSSRAHPSVVTALQRMRTNYERLRFVNLHPSAMRDYSPATSDLGERGEGMSAVVYRVCKNSKDRRQLVAWLSALCAPELRDIKFEHTTTDEVLIRLVERDGTEITGRVVSDGTLRFLAYLAALYSAPEDSVFLLEEIENGLHPTRVHLLIELMEQFAEARNIQFIATTHSPQALLALSDKALRDVVLFARPEGSDGTVTERLGDLPHFEEVTKRTHIDQLFSTGWLEHAL